MMKYLQKLGKSMMLPVAVLPVCGILMGIGYFLCPSAMIGNASQLSALAKFGFFLVKSGGAIIDNMPILFVIGVSLGMSDDNHGAVCLAGIVSFLIVTNLLNPKIISIVFPYINENQTINLAFQKIANPFIAIITGIISAVCYNNYKDVKLVDALSFFSGRRFVVIATTIYSLLLSLILFFIWPLLFSAFVICGNWILKMEGIGVGIYAFLNRLLIPSGLHHALNNVFWFDTIGIGDLTAYWAGKTSSDVSWDVGMYMSGFFPSMMFGVPGAALAIISSSKNKKKAMGLFLSSAICAFICGLTEPFEFAFMFLAFPLYIVYSLLYGVFAFVTYVVSFRAGFSFSGGALDLLFSSSLPAAKNTLLIVPLGIAAFITYYFVFKFMIAKFNYKIVDDDDSIISKGNISSSTILEGLGNKDNIVSIDCCATRLRLEVKDISKVDEKKIKNAGALGFIKGANNTCQVIIGLKVQQVLEEIKGIMKDAYIRHGDNISAYLCSKAEKIEFEHIVKLKNGMHARPASKIISVAKENDAKVMIYAFGKKAEGDSITSIMSLGIVDGTKIKVSIEGKNVNKIKREIISCLSEV